MVVRLIAALLVMFASTSCDFSGCESVRKESEYLFQQYSDLRNERYEQWQTEVKRWESTIQAEELRRNAEVSRCMQNPYDYYKKSQYKGPIDFFGGFNSYKQQFGTAALCESLQGIGNLYGPKPKDDSSSYGPAVAKYALSMTVIKNNPKCFSATQVAEAEQGLKRLIPNP